MGNGALGGNMGEEMYQILAILLNNDEKSISAQKISQQLLEKGYAVGVKKVLSYAKYMNNLFREWIEDDLISIGKKTGLSIQNDFFTDGELQFLVDSVSFHQDLKNEDKEKLVSKLLKLSSSFQKQRLVHFEPLAHELSFSLLVNLTTIMKAIENQTVLSYEYVNYDIEDERLVEVTSQNGNNGSQYLISPYQIISQNNHYYLIGYNRKHASQLTTYRIDRMRKVQTTRDVFVDIREQFDLSEEIAKMTNMYISSRKDILQIECQQKLLREIVSKFGMDIHVQKLYDDRYFVSIEDVPISDGLIGWIMMLQDQIQVVSPLYLKEEMNKRIHKMLDMYEKENNVF